MGQVEVDQVHGGVGALELADGADRGLAPVGGVHHAVGGQVEREDILRKYPSHDCQRPTSILTSPLKSPPRQFKRTNALWSPYVEKNNFAPKHLYKRFMQMFQLIH